MSIKRRNVFLLVRVKLERNFPIIVPLSLAVLHETTQEAQDWLGLWRALFGKQRGYQLVSNLLQWLTEFIEGIRKIGRYRLVKVEVPDVKVFIDLW